MRCLQHIGMILLLLLGLPGAALAEEGASERITYRDRGGQVDLVGELTFPAGETGRPPVMIVVHGSSGLSQREAEWAAFLRQRGIATFVVDYFGPRGVTARSPVQPTPVTDIFQAMLLLAGDARIDSNRIGLIGFSRGASMALAAANDGGRSTGGVKAALAVALYPGCRRAVIDADSTLPPVLILIGSEDSYSTVAECQWVAGTAVGTGRTVELKIYEGATHAWDGGKDATFFHEAAAKTVVVRASAEFTARARADVQDFLARHGMLPAR
ncbi:MAG: alpha/beta [Rhodospirillaceae bacterium]|nr:MAG: alpha/beta [Rhodospirillaceae bacterium]TNC97732.1 MAG: alpha/beta hydrolase [Stygiobacter sp.]